jgi:hypothetical protein
MMIGLPKGGKYRHFLVVDEFESHYHEGHEVTRSHTKSHEGKPYNIDSVVTFVAFVVDDFLSLS